MKNETIFTRTPQGQLLYDLGFAKISEAWIARKHHLPIDKVRELKAKVRKIIKPRKGRTR